VTREKAPPRDSPLGRLRRDLHALRRDEGLTQEKTADARELCGLPIIEYEVRRFDAQYGWAPTHAEVAYSLLRRLVQTIENRKTQQHLFVAFALGGRSAGKNLSDRRRQLAAELHLEEDTIRTREDAAVNRLANRLIKIPLNEPATRFGDYLEQSHGTQDDDDDADFEPARYYYDDPHSDELFGDVAWACMEVSARVNKIGYVVRSECSGLLKAVSDRVTDYQICGARDAWRTDNFRRIELLEGGVPEETKDIDGYMCDLRLSRELRPDAKPLRVRWRMERDRPSSWHRRESEVAIIYEAKQRGRNLVLRARFSEGREPLNGRSYVAKIPHRMSGSEQHRWPGAPIREPDELWIPLTTVRPAEAATDEKAGRVLSCVWPQIEPGKAYVLRWDWEDMATVARFRPMVVVM
jgi:hypothetical protein